jgi:hypothetical protein
MRNAMFYWVVLVCFEKEVTETLKLETEYLVPKSRRRQRAHVSGASPKPESPSEPM